MRVANLGIQLVMSDLFLPCGRPATHHLLPVVDHTAGDDGHEGASCEHNRTLMLTSMLHSSNIAFRVVAHVFS